MESLSANSELPAKIEVGTSSQSVTPDMPDTMPSNRGFVMQVVRSTVGFALLYVALMVPTYVLPYFGSNSAIVGAFGVAIGKGLMPQTWAHLWFLVSLILVAWMRGATVGKGFLPAISFCAALFDMTPVLSVIPLVPTVLHVVALVIGVSGKSENGDESVLRRTGSRAVMATAATTLLAIGGSILFVTTAQKGLRALGSDIAKPADPLRGFKAPAAKPVTPQAPPQQAAAAPQQAPASTPAPAPVLHKPVAEPVAPPSVVAAPPKPAPIPTPAKPAATQVTKHVAPSVAPSAPNPNKAAIAAMLSDANGCMATKRYDCAITNAKSVLHLDPANAEAAQLQQRATTAQNQALQSISIR